jgi:hypothetical protein
MNEVKAAEFLFSAALNMERPGTFQIREHSLTGWVGGHRTLRSSVMKKLIVAFAMGAGTLLATGATAAPLSNGMAVMADNGIENVRMVCDEFGQCYRTRGGRRIVVEREYGDSYNYYAPRERYIERRGYYNDGPSVGIGVGPGGVGVGVGVGPRW